MDRDYGRFFRQLRTDKNISISSLADEYISKGMISKFERNESEISVSRFFHLLDKIRVRPTEFELAKNKYSPTGFESLLHQVQKESLAGNFKKLEKIGEEEFANWSNTKDIYSYLNYLMITALIKNSQGEKIKAEELNFLMNYLFKCENWGLYELTLYTNSMSALPIETVLIFSKALPQKILMLRDSGKILEICINTIINTLVLCIEYEKVKEGIFFIKILENFNLSEVMLFERMLFNVYKGIFLMKFTDEKQDGKQLLDGSLSMLQFANCNNLYNFLLEESERLLFSI